MQRIPGIDVITPALYFYSFALGLQIFMLCYNSKIYSIHIYLTFIWLLCMAYLYFRDLQLWCSIRLTQRKHEITGFHQKMCVTTSSSWFSPVPYFFLWFKMKWCFISMLFHPVFIPSLLNNLMPLWIHSIAGLCNVRPSGHIRPARELH